LLLRYGFVIAILIICFGFSLQFYKTYQQSNDSTDTVQLLIQSHRLEISRYENTESFLKKLSSELTRTVQKLTEKNNNTEIEELREGNITPAINVLNNSITASINQDETAELYRNVSALYILNDPYKALNYYKKSLELKPNVVVQDQLKKIVIYLEKDNLKKIAISKRTKPKSLKNESIQRYEINKKTTFSETRKVEKKSIKEVTPNSIQDCHNCINISNTFSQHGFFPMIKNLKNRLEKEFLNSGTKLLSDKFQQNYVGCRQQKSFHDWECKLIYQIYLSYLPTGNNSFVVQKHTPLLINSDLNRFFSKAFEIRISSFSFINYKSNEFNSTIKLKSRSPILPIYNYHGRGIQEPPIRVSGVINNNQDSECTLSIKSVSKYSHRFINDRDIAQIYYKSFSLLKSFLAKQMQTDILSCEDFIAQAELFLEESELYSTLS